MQRAQHRKPTRPALVDALLHPEVYPHPVDRVELVETHISWVFPASDRVYKVKNPVNQSFLDFDAARDPVGDLHSLIQGVK